MLRIRRPSPAMGVALLALFIGLSGTSFAAVRDFLPQNSVGTTQLKNDSVTRAKIAHHSITSVLIKPGGLTASDFAAGQLPAGPKGATGPAGPAGVPGAKGDKGDQGPAGVVGTMKVVTERVWIPAGHSSSVSIVGTTHQQAIAAGTSWAPDEEGLLATVSVRPIIGGSDQPIGYEAHGYNGTAHGHWFLLHVSFG